MLDHEQELRFCKARRGAIAHDFTRLNKEQQNAVLATEGPLLLLAGAGSGKTTVLINRIANLIRYGCGSDSVEVPDWVTEEDLAFLEGYAADPTGKDADRARRLCQMDPAAPWTILAITFTNKAAGELKERLAAIRAAVNMPIAAGFGISTKEQVKVIGEVADGFIVGSALVKMLAKDGKIHPEELPF